MHLHKTWELGSSPLTQNSIMSAVLCLLLGKYRLSVGTALWHLVVSICLQVSGPVRACGLSEDCRHLLAAMGNGFIFRFEHIQQKTPSIDEEAGNDAAMEE